MWKKPVTLEEKRAYLEWFFRRFLEDDEFSRAFSKGYGPRGCVTEVTEIFRDYEIFVGDMIFDLLLNPGKVFFYAEERVNRLYFTIRLCDINRHVLVIGYILYVVTSIKRKFSQLSRRWL